MKEAYQAVFGRQWPAWVGGLLLGALSVATFAWARPWGIIAGPREWADWGMYSAGIYGSHPAANPLLSTGSVLTFGLIVGAFGSALLSRQFALKVPPPFEFARSAFGGTLMGCGAAMAAGCNVGGFFSATSALSLGGLLMMAGLLIGAFLEVHYFYWEVQHLRFKRGEGRPKRPGEGEFDFRKVQPHIGAVVLAGFLVIAAIYLLRGSQATGEAGYSYATVGGLLIAALLFGIIMHRSRFAFLQAFREPFINGNAGMVRGVAIAVVISVIGFAALKSTGFRAESFYVQPTVWFGSFIGGLVFGFGMPFAGGCASGCCWRTGEGSVKVMVALVFMAFSNSLFQKLLDTSAGLRSLMGSQVFLPDHITYYGSIALIVGVMAAFYAVMSWNEKTRKFI